MNTVHKVTNGEGKVTGWAVVANGNTLVDTFTTIEEACKVADTQDNTNTLAALKSSKTYSRSAVQVVMADTGFATELEAAMALYKCGGDVNQAIDLLLF